jgi:uncharacterized membrane protein YkgB
VTTLASTTQNSLTRALYRSGLLADDLDYHIVRAAMVIMFLFFGYQKWFPYEFERLVPFISNGPLIWWLYPAFGHAGASYFLGASEWTFGSLLLAGLWDKRLGVLGALGSSSLPERLSPALDCRTGGGLGSGIEGFPRPL